MSYQENRNKTTRGISLVRETEDALSLIRAGMAALQQTKPYSINQIVFMTLLASGLERLMKVIIIIHELETQKQPLTKKQLQRSFGHNLISLRNEIISRCYNPQYLVRPIAQLDLDFIKDDEDLNEMLLILSDFAASDRYIFMDATVDPENMSGEWPERRWETLETKHNAIADYLDPTKTDDLKVRGTTMVLILLEKFVRALARLLAMAGLGIDAKSLSVITNDFLLLDDKKLGTKKYTL